MFNDFFNQKIKPKMSDKAETRQTAELYFTMIR